MTSSKWCWPPGLHTRRQVAPIFLLFFPHSAPHLYEAVEPHMGTLVRISLYTTTEDHARSAFRAAFDRIAEIDRALSDYRPDSELNRLCRAPARTPVPLSPGLYRVLEASQRLAEETEGAFDVTQGPLIRLWRQARRDHHLPSQQALHDAASQAGYRHLHLDPIARTATLDQPAMQLDLGAIGKGFAADEALAVLRRLGIHQALIAASGDLVFGDSPPGREGWTIRAAAADQPLELSNAAVSTSGAAEQSVELEGRRYSHILDPATGLGLTTPITVTVIARHGIDADSLATAVSVLGPQRGRALAARHNARAIIAGLLQ